MVESKENELLNAMDCWVNSWNDRDIEEAYKGEGDVIGFGWRSPNFRDWRKVTKDEFRNLFKNMYASMKDFHGSYENLGLRIINDTGLLCGYFTEQITKLDGSKEIVKVRFSSTWIRQGGEWTQVMSHRDAQFTNL
jgi:hypothetical protein